MSLNGIDISNWKSDINIEAIAADFVGVQVTWGAGEVTANGIINGVWTGADGKIQDAIRTGKRFLYIHYIRGVGAEAEANFFARNTTGYLHKGIPAIDWEAGDNSAWGNAGYLEAFLTKYRQLTGVSPIVYCQASAVGVIQAVLNRQNCGLWCAAYGLNPPLSGYLADANIPGSYAGAMRQYSSRGHLAGYGGALDFDKFWGDTDAFDKYADGHGTPEPIPEPAPAVTTNVHYGMRLLNGGWLPEVTNFNNVDDSGFAGDPNHEHDLLYVRVDSGSMRYHSHVLGGGWLPWVTKGDPGDIVNGCAGNPGQIIDGVQCYYTTPGGQTMMQAYYRSQTTQRTGWLNVCCDDGTSVPGFDSWAGIYGEPMDRLQISVANRSLF